jgi:hypothetical protein
MRYRGLGAKAGQGDHAASLFVFSGFRGFVVTVETMQESALGW